MYLLAQRFCACCENNYIEVNYIKVCNTQTHLVCAVKNQNTFHYKKKNQNIKVFRGSTDVNDLIKTISICRYVYICAMFCVRCVCVHTHTHCIPNTRMTLLYLYRICAISHGKKKWTNSRQYYWIANLVTLIERHSILLAY